MHAWYTKFLELQRPPKGHSSLFLQLQDSTSGFLSLVISSLSSLLLWLLSMLYIFLMSVRVPPLLFLTLELRSTGVKYSSLPWNPLSFRASSYLPLFSSKIFLHEDSLLILWFTALGICLSTDLG